MAVEKRSVTIILICILLWAFGITAFAAPPQVPSGLEQIEDTQTSVRISWNDVNEDGYYFVEYSLDQKQWTKYTATQLDEVEINGLSSGKTYYVRVRSANDLSASYNPSNEKAQGDVSQATASIQAVTTPANLTGIKQTAATTSTATLKWNPVQGANLYKVVIEQYYEDDDEDDFDDEDDDEDAWYLSAYYSDDEDDDYDAYDDEEIVQYTAQSTITLNGLKAGEDCEVVVYPINRSLAGYDAVGKKYGTTAYAAPGKVENIKFYQSSNNGKFYTKKVNCYNFGWNALECEGYQIQWCDKNNKVIRTTQIRDDNNYISQSLNGKLRNKPFKMRVRAYVLSDDSIPFYGSWSNYKTIVPYATITSNKKMGKNQVKITWKKISGAKTYTVYRGTGLNGKYKKVGSVTSNSMVLKNVSKSRYSYIYVTANKVKINGKNNSTTKGVSRHDSLRIRY